MDFGNIQSIYELNKLNNLFYLSKNIEHELINVIKYNIQIKEDIIANLCVKSFIQYQTQTNYIVTSNLILHSIHNTELFHYLVNHYFDLINEKIIRKSLNNFVNIIILYTAGIKFIEQDLNYACAKCGIIEILILCSIIKPSIISMRIANYFKRWDIVGILHKIFCCCY